MTDGLAQDRVPAFRRRLMARIRSRDTSPELVARQVLTAAGVRYRLHDPRTPGRPDIVIPSWKVAIFVDGCFWHGCPRHYVRPHVRRKYWDGKLHRNRERRKRVLLELASMNWKAVQVWECEIGGGKAVWLARVLRLLRPT